MKLPGTRINKFLNGQENKLSFQSIKQLFDEKILLNPPFQTDLDEDKVKEMVDSYLLNPSYLIFKNKIIVAVINNEKLYLIDGQHRLQMAYELYSNHNKDDMLYFCYFFVNSDDEMKQLFFEINKDSYKNQQYVTLDDFKLSLYDYTKMYLEQKYSIFFSKKKNINKNIYSISEFLQILLQNKFFDRFNNMDEIINTLETKNNKFYKLISYRNYFIEDSKLFYVDEHEPINQHFIMSLKNNNFIDYLLNDVTPDHKFKYKKQKIPPKLRIEVWRKEFGNNDNGKCPLCDKIINNEKNGFHCSHIISEANGGTTDIDNLRPLCEPCNLKMGKNNWTFADASAEHREDISRCVSLSDAEHSEDIKN
jgi:hypothetical protein